MSKDTRLGDTMPTNRNAKWSEMRPGKGEMSNEWHEMEPSSPRTSEKWVDIDPSKAVMSEKWVDMNAGSTSFSDKWHSMKQEGRTDPYSMAPSEGNRTQPFKPMSKEKPDNKVGRATQHNEFGSTREI